MTHPTAALETNISQIQKLLMDIEKTMAAEQFKNELGNASDLAREEKLTTARIVAFEAVLASTTAAAYQENVIEFGKACNRLEAFARNRGQELQKRRHALSKIPNKINAIAQEIQNEVHRFISSLPLLQQATSQALKIWELMGLESLNLEEIETENNQFDLVVERAIRTLPSRLKEHQINMELAAARAAEKVAADAVSDAQLKRNLLTRKIADKY